MYEKQMKNTKYSNSGVGVSYGSLNMDIDPCLSFCPIV